MELTYRDWYGTPYWSERTWNDKRFPIRYLVVHDTEGPRDAAFAWWSAPDNPYKSSAHDLIDTSGVIWRCVPYEKAAHHAGYAHIEGFNTLNPESGRQEPNANLASIGVELEYPLAPETPPWPEIQLAVAVLHVRRLVMTYEIPRASVFMHKTIDPLRKTDPRNFDWGGFLDRVYANETGLPEGEPEATLEKLTWWMQETRRKREEAAKLLARADELELSNLRLAERVRDRP